MRQDRRLAAAVLLFVTLLVAACSTDDDAATTSTTEATPTATGPFFDPCGGVDLAEVAAQTGFSNLQLVAETTSDCQWVAPTSARVSFNWYRGSPIDRERGGVELTKDNVQDVEIGGHSGVHRVGGDRVRDGHRFRSGFHRMERADGRVGANDVGIQKVCQAVRELARMSIERAK